MTVTLNQNFVALLAFEQARHNKSSQSAPPGASHLRVNHMSGPPQSDLFKASPTCSTVGAAGYLRQDCLTTSEARHRNESDAMVALLKVWL